MHRCAPALSLLLVACASSDTAPPPGGPVAAELRDVSDPLAAVAERIGSTGSLLDSTHDNPGTDEALFRLAWEVAGLLSRPEFGPVPVLAGRLRARMFFTARGSMDDRRAAAKECRRLLERIKAHLGAAAATRTTHRS